MTGIEATKRLAALRPPDGGWQWRARRRILEALEHHGDLEGDELLAQVDAAYPFGDRKHYPYKAWLAERRILIGLMTPEPVMPSADEAAACMVARDLVELGREDEARALLDAQAPNRLTRKCPACGALPGRECSVWRLSTPEDHAEWRRQLLAGAFTMDTSPPPQSAQTMLVPHEARLTGYITDPGPLFRRA